MRRAEYESTLQQYSSRDTSLMARYMRETSRLDALLADLNVRVNIYEEGNLWCYRILGPDNVPLIEGLAPAYANAPDYRRIVLTIRGEV